VAQCSTTTHVCLWDSTLDQYIVHGSALVCVGGDVGSTVIRCTNYQLTDLLTAMCEQDVTPTCSLSDMCEHLQDDQVMYCLLRLTTTFDMSTTVKFVYIHWSVAHIVSLMSYSVNLLIWHWPLLVVVNYVSCVTVDHPSSLTAHGRFNRLSSYSQSTSQSPKI